MSSNILAVISGSISVLLTAIIIIGLYLDRRKLIKIIGCIEEEQKETQKKEREYLRGILEKQFEVNKELTDSLNHIKTVLSTIQNNRD